MRKVAGYGCVLFAIFLEITLLSVTARGLAFKSAVESALIAVICIVILLTIWLIGARLIDKDL